MKQFYQGHLLQLKRSVLLLAFFAGTSVVSLAQIYKTTLSGPNEAPPNNSPGTGSATVTITGTSMRVQVTFSGLVSGTTASHIHAPTAAAGTGTAGVATTTPTFTGFPTGVTAGTYDHTFDMTQASSYNPAFITANGGTPASAFVVLKAAMDAGKSYLNIHSTTFGGGEIRGFLVVCPTINLSIPDAFALPSGTLANTVYPAYGPASSLTLNTNISGGTGPYTYSWSNGATTSWTTVSPTVPTTYMVNAWDSRGCPSNTASRTVNVMDVSSGHNGNKIDVCHKNGKTLSIGYSAVVDHLGHGDMLGSCGESRPIGIPVVADPTSTSLTVRALSNPTSSYFQVQLTGKVGSSLQVRVYDVHGRVMETRNSLPANQTIKLGSNYNPGIYLVEVMQGCERQTLKLIKE